MHFREQGRKVQCIRTKYDAKIGGSRQKVVATFDRTRNNVPGELLRKLPKEESEALFFWWRARVNARAIREKKEIGGNATAHLRMLEQAIAHCDPETLNYQGIRRLLSEIEIQLQYKEKDARRIQRRRAKQAGGNNSPK